jgi:hypothetical protein
MEIEKSVKHLKRQNNMKGHSLTVIGLVLRKNSVLTAEGMASENCAVAAQGQLEFLLSFEFALLSQAASVEKTARFLKCGWEINGRRTVTEKLLWYGHAMMS